MIDVFKYLLGIYDTDRPQLTLHQGRDTRGYSFKLAKEQFRLDIRSRFFSTRFMDTWNSLPESVVATPSVSAFKRRLDAHWANLQSLYDPECLQ